MAQPIKNFLTSLIPNHEPWKIKLIQEWNSAIGDLHTQVTLLNIQRTQLLLGVYDAAWLQELYILSPVILKTINTFLGNEYLTTIRFKNIGYPRKEKAALHNTNEQEKKSIQKPHPLTFHEEGALAKITDRELSNALKQYLNRCKEYV